LAASPESIPSQPPKCEKKGRRGGGQEGRMGAEWQGRQERYEGKRGQKREKESERGKKWQERTRGEESESMREGKRGQEGVKEGKRVQGSKLPSVIYPVEPSVDVSCSISYESNRIIINNNLNAQAPCTHT
jgi:hypothetical protein